MKVSYQYSISGREIKVLDNLFTSKEMSILSEKLAVDYFRRIEFATMETADRKFFIREFDCKEIEKSAWGIKIKFAVGAQFPKAKRLKLFRSYCNLGLYGDTDFPHRDCLENMGHITALLYANLNWKREWGGETMFYNDHGDSEIAITPRPGRVAIFHGAIEHRAGIVSRMCSESRLVWAFKFKAS